jgi:hypothetical protein
MSLFEEIINKQNISCTEKNKWWEDKSIQQIFRDACDYVISNQLDEECHYNSDYGIVICGGGKYMITTYLVIRSLRYFECNLPITLFCYNRDELNEQDERILKNYNIKVRFINEENILFRNLRSYAIKIYAICYSEYKHNILIDSDNLPSCNLENYIATEEYDDECIFFKDQLHDLDNRSLRQNYLNEENCKVFGVEYNGYESTDSGLIFINKELYWKELLLTKWYNEFNEFYYKHNLGDKDLYLFAWKKLNSVFHYNNYVPKFWDKLCLVHYDAFGVEICSHLAGGRNKIARTNELLDTLKYGDIYRNFYYDYYNLKKKNFRIC